MIKQGKGEIVNVTPRKSHPAPQKVANAVKPGPIKTNQKTTQKHTKEDIVNVSLRMGRIVS